MIQIMFNSTAIFDRRCAYSEAHCISPPAAMHHLTFNNQMAMQGEKIVSQADMYSALQEQAQDRLQHHPEGP